METELERLKRENYRKQMLATRLLLQRNHKDFFISKIKFALAESLQKVGGRPNPNFNIFEAINVLTERAVARWDKYEKLLLNNQELIKKNNILNEEINYFNHEADIKITSEGTDRFNPVPSAIRDEMIYMATEADAHEKPPEKPEPDYPVKKFFKNKPKAVVESPYHD